MVSLIYEFSTDWAESAAAEFGIDESTVRSSYRCAIALELAHSSVVPRCHTIHLSTIFDRVAAAVCALQLVSNNCSAWVASMSSVSKWLVLVRCRSHANCHRTKWFVHVAVPRHTSIPDDTSDSRTFSNRLSCRAVARVRICTVHRLDLDCCGHHKPVGMQCLHFRMAVVAASAVVASVAPIASNCECRKYFPIAAARSTDFGDFDFAFAFDWCASDTGFGPALVVLVVEWCRDWWPYCFWRTQTVIDSDWRGSVAAIWCTSTGCRHRVVPHDRICPIPLSTNSGSSRWVVAAYPLANGMSKHGISVVACTASRNPHRNWCRRRIRWPNRSPRPCAIWTNAVDWRRTDKWDRPPHHRPSVRASTPNGYPICSGQTMDQTIEPDSGRASAMNRREIWINLGFLWTNCTAKYAV